MKNFFRFSLLALLITFLGAITNAQDNSPVVTAYFDGPSWTPQTDTGITCSPSPPGIIRDDGTYENGYRTVSNGDSTRFTHKMTMPYSSTTLTAICVTWTATASISLTYDLVVYDTTGPGGGPGNLVASVIGVTAPSIAIFPGHSRYRYTVNIPLTQNSYYIGARWDNNPILACFISADENGTSGGPAFKIPTLGGVYTWTSTVSEFPNFKNHGIRAEGMPGGPAFFPNVLYYKFEQNPGPLLTPNCATPPAGTNPAPITAPLTLTSGGQFDSCLSGTGGTGAVQTGWNCNLANGNWTISFWVSNLIDLNPTYLFGDVGSTSFRCFYGGAALANNMLLRGPLTDILIPCPMPGSHVFHIVYDGTNVRVYRNGALLSTNPRTINMPTGTGFRVGGYNNTNFSMSGKMDEFKIVRYAMSTAEVSQTWNWDLGGCGIVGINNNNNQIPELYKLSQNYPNPFNPATQISFGIPKAGNVKLVVYDILGREVATLVNEFRTAGNYSVDFDASNYASGVYLYRFESGDFVETKKMLLVK